MSDSNHVLNENKSVIRITNDDATPSNETKEASEAIQPNSNFLNVTSQNALSQAKVNLFNKAPSLSFEVYDDRSVAIEDSPPANRVSNAGQMFLNVIPRAPSISRSLSSTAPSASLQMPAHSSTLTLNWPTVQNKIDDLNE